jgi:hypothetical protein
MSLPPLAPSKRLRAALLLGAALLILALAYFAASRQGGAGVFDTPDRCLETYRDAALDGTAEAFRRCLAEPLRSDSPALLAEAHGQLEAVQHWNQYAPEVTGADAQILVDQVRRDGTIHRVRYHLRRSSSGWLLAGVGPPQLIRPPIRPGTTVNDAAGEEQPTPEP